MTFVLAFALFLLAVAGMGVGLIFAGKRLSRSCGGLGAGGEALEDCLCARKEAQICPSEDESGLLELSQLGYPKRGEAGAAERARPASTERGAPGQLSV